MRWAVLVAAVGLSGAARAEEAPPPSPFSLEGAGRTSLCAAAFTHLLSSGLGAEVGASVALTHALSLGVAVTVGTHPGGQINLGLDLPLRAFDRLYPRAQLRFTVNPLNDRWVPGAGGMLAGVLDLGPGRIVLGVALEGYAVPFGYRSLAALALFGFELDVFGPPAG